MMGGGGLKVSPPFLFVKTIEKVIRLCIVLIFLGDMDNFRDFNLVLMVGDRICPLQIDR